MDRISSDYPPGSVCVVTGEILRYATFVQSLNAMNLPPGTTVVFVSGAEIANNRSLAVEKSLDANPAADWILFLDDDQVMKADTAKRLLETMRDGKYDIVAPLILRRTPPWQTVAYLNDPADDATPFDPGSLTGHVRVAAVGTGGMMVRSHVFTALEKPWFRCGQIDPRYLQEDIEFCRRVRGAGFSIGLDLSTPMGHITPMEIWPARDPAGKLVVALVGNNGTLVPVEPVVESAREPEPIGR